MSSPSFTPQAQFFIQEIVNEFTPTWINIDSIVSHAISVLQTVLQKFATSSGHQIEVTIEILNRLVKLSDAILEEQVQLEKVISTVIPQVLSALTQVEEGCIILCDDVAELLTKTSWWCRKKTIKPLTLEYPYTQKRLVTRTNGATVPTLMTPITSSTTPHVRIEYLTRAISGTTTWQPKIQTAGQADLSTAPDQVSAASVPNHAQ